MDKKERVRFRIGEILGKTQEEIQEDLADDVSFANLGVESFTLVNMVIDLQETFKVRLNQEDLVGAQKIGDLINLIVTRMK
jgi:acyl carrier protein